MTIKKDSDSVSGIVGFVTQLDPNIEITEAQKKILAAATTVNGIFVPRNAGKSLDKLRY